MSPLPVSLTSVAETPNPPAPMATGHWPMTAFRGLAVRVVMTGGVAEPRMDSNAVASSRVVQVWVRVVVREVSKGPMDASQGDILSPMVLGAAMPLTHILTLCIIIVEAAVPITSLWAKLMARPCCNHYWAVPAAAADAVAHYIPVRAAAAAAGPCCWQPPAY